MDTIKSAFRRLRVTTLLLILYPQYPEVRLSGFLLGEARGPFADAEVLAAVSRAPS